MQKSQRLLCLQNIFINHVKPMSAAKIAIQLDDKVNQDLQNVVYKPRKHPGVMRYNNVQMPNEIVKAIEASTIDYPMKKLVNDGEALGRYLRARHPPISQLEAKEKYMEIQSKFISREKIDLEKMTEEERINLGKNLHDKVLQTCKKRVYGWKPMDYDDVTALTYLFGRSAQEYAVLVRIFGEMNDRMPDFKPRSFLDFGSGVGTGTWAARHFWDRMLFEYFCVDSSSSMNDLADIILRGGRGNKANPLKTISFRQFLPASNELTYDLVLCAYTLFELSSPEIRLQKLLKLWNKTEQFLVIVEQGTNAGFKLISEARDFLLQYGADVFAPCPHTQECPRFLANDSTPCNFEVRYTSLPLASISKIRRELFSYVVLQKKSLMDQNNIVGIPKINPETKTRAQMVDDENNKIDKTSNNSSTGRWPRIIRPTLVRSKHTVCRMCTNDGCLKEVVVTAAKHGKMPYYCVRSSNWGDLLPITLTENKKEQREEHLEEIVEKPLE